MRGTRRALWRVATLVTLALPTAACGGAESTSKADAIDASSPPDGSSAPNDAQAPDPREACLIALNDSLGDLGGEGSLNASSTLVAAYGMDERPESTTCLPLPKPTGLVSDPFPQTLLATGCFRPEDLREPVAGVIPYSVNAPLWSDGAKKRRWMVLPAGTQITVGVDGDLDFPNGTMMLKSFERDGKMLETRFFVRHNDGDWAGYTYVWDEAGANAATLLGEESQSRTIGAQTWVFPSRANCLSCHTAAAGHTLGLEIGQLNGDFVYPGDRRANQLATLEHIGLFKAPVGDPSKLVRFATPALASTGSLEQRARAYLHSNCSHCHRPEGLQTDGDIPDIDLRHHRDLMDTNLLDKAPVRGAFGVQDAMLIKPGVPAQSMVVQRMTTLVANVRMPAIGRTTVDDVGVKVLSAWIESLGKCQKPALTDARP